MEFYFWQNIVSPHQMPYLICLSKMSQVNKVVILVPEFLSEERIKLGWSSVDVSSPKLAILVSPSDDEIVNIFNKKILTSYHFFSGVRGFDFVFKAFKKSLNYEIKRGLIVEGPYLYLRPKWLHFLKVLFFEKVYFSHFSTVFAFGDDAVRWYRFWNSDWNVFPFSYSINPPAFTENIEGIPRFLYVGSLSNRKNVKFAIGVFKKFLKNKFSFDIIGDGQERESLEKFVNSNLLNNHIRFLGVISQNEIHSIISRYDVLILPSKHDGWGAVVNEALMAGLFVLCSNKCGSKSLLDEKFLGKTFSVNNEKDIHSKIKWVFDNLEFVRSSRSYRHNWSKKINGYSIASYMFDCLFNNQFQSINPPWKSNL